MVVQLARTLFLVGLMVVMGTTAAPAQVKPPVKPPTFPPINPAIARLVQTIAGLDGPGFAIAYGDKADVLVAACEEGTLQAWQKDVLMGIRSGTGTPHVLRGHKGPVLALAWNGGPVVASTGIDRKIMFWSVPEASLLKSEVSPTILRALAMSPDGTLMAGGGEDFAVHLWDVALAKPREKMADHQDWVIALAFSPDGKQLASADYLGRVLLWDVADGKKVRYLTPQTIPAPKEPLDPVPATTLAFSPDGKLLAVGSGNGLIQLVNVADGKLVRPIPGHTSAVTALAFHPTGNLLVSGSKDRTIRLWNPANAQPIKTLEGHEAWVEGVVFTANYTRLASVSADQTVRLWDLTEPPKK